MREEKYLERLGFDRALERAARVIGAESVRTAGHDYVRSTVEHAIALLLSQMDRLRLQHAAATERLISHECEVGTELLQMDAVRWWYLDSRMERWRDQQQLRARLASAVSERTREQVRFEQEVRSLEDRLLILVHRHAAVGGVENGH